MISKKHWTIFCNDVHQALLWQLKPTINGVLVREVDNTNHKIRTRDLATYTIAVYTYEDSIEEKTLAELYSTVKLTNVTLKNFKQLFKLLKTDRIFDL